jgi:hypothetical protein
MIKLLLSHTPTVGKLIKKNFLEFAKSCTSQLPERIMTPGETKTLNDTPKKLINNEGGAYTNNCQIFPLTWQQIDELTIRRFLCPNS